MKTLCGITLGASFALIPISPVLSICLFAVSFYGIIRSV